MQVCNYIQYNIYVNQALEPLIKAIEAEDVDLTLQLIEQNASILQGYNADSDDEPTPLHIAAQHGFIRAIEALISKNPAMLYLPALIDQSKGEDNEDVSDNDWRIPIDWALEFEKIDALKYIFAKQVSLTLDEEPLKEVSRCYHDYSNLFEDNIASYIIKKEDEALLEWYLSDHNPFAFECIINFNEQGERMIDSLTKEGKINLLNCVIKLHPRCIDEMSQLNNIAGEPLKDPSLISSVCNIEVVKFLIAKGYTFYIESIADLFNKFGFEGLDLLKTEGISLNLMDSYDRPTFFRSYKYYEFAMILIARGVEIDLSDSRIFSHLTNNDFLSKAFFNEYGLLAVNKLLEESIKHKQSGRINVYDRLSEAFHKEACKHIDTLNSQNFNKKDAKNIPDKFEKIKLAYKGSSSVPEISEKERPRDYHIFKALKEVHKEKLDILTKDQEITTKGFGLYLGNPNIKEAETPEATEKAKKAAVKASEAFNAVGVYIMNFLTPEEEGKAKAMVPSFLFDIASTQIAEQEEANQAAKRQKIGDCLTETAE